MLERGVVVMFRAAGLVHRLMNSPYPLALLLFAVFVPLNSMMGTDVLMYWLVDIEVLALVLWMSSGVLLEM
tara:strand:- start:12 stop:224 length:213 start_codon:yes stop_codon:yes gene_type:complete